MFGIIGFFFSKESNTIVPFSCVGPSTLLSSIDEIPTIQLNGCADDVLLFELDPLSEASKAVAEKELRETPEIKAQAIAELRTLLQGKSAK